MSATKRAHNIILAPSGFKDCIPAFCLTVKIVCESIYGVESAEIYHNNSVLNIYYYILKTLSFLSTKSMDFYVYIRMLR